MIPPIGSIEAALGPLQPTSPAEAATNAAEAQPSQPSFGEVLKGALNQLEGSQQAAQTASAEVATGTTTDPQAAVVQVQNGLLEMQLASAMRNKATEAINQIMQTQV